MGDRSFNIVRILLIGAAGGCYLYEYISMADDESFTDGSVLSFWGVLFVIIAIWSFLKDRKQYKRTKSISSYYPTMVAGLFVIAGFTAQQMLIARDSSPVLLQAGSDGGFNAAWFEFREDGTYKFANSGGIGATYTRGKYQLKGNNITLDRDKLDEAVHTKYLLIRTKEERPSTEMMLYQVDRGNNIVDRSLVFIVHEDHRNNRSIK